MADANRLLLSAIVVAAMLVITGCPSVPNVQFDGWLYDTYPSGNGDVIFQGLNGGYLVVGTTWIEGQILQYMGLFLDGSGNLVSEFSLPGVFSQARTGPDSTALLTEDGHAYLVGVDVYPVGMDADNGRLRVVKIDPDGKEIWDNTYGDEHWVPYSAVETSDGGIVVGAKEITTSLSQTLFVKLDKHGDVVWTSPLGASDISVDPRDSIETGEGNIVAAGTRATSEATGSDAAIMRIDDSGNLLWFTHYVRTQTQNTRALEPAPDGGYYLGGITTLSSLKRRPYLLKTNADGEFEWDKEDIYTPEYAGADVQIWDMVVDDEGYIAMVGDEITVTYIGGTIPITKGNSFVMRLDANGNLVWKTDIGGLTYGIDYTQQGTYITTGVADKYVRVLEFDKAGKVVN